MGHPLRDRPDTEGAKKLAPIAPPPIATAGQAADREDEGAPGLQGRGLCQRHPRRARAAPGRQGHGLRQLAVVAGKVYAIVDKGGKREVKVIASRSSICRTGSSSTRARSTSPTPKDIPATTTSRTSSTTRRSRSKIYDKLPGDDRRTAGSSSSIGPDGKLYVPVGAPCNICDPSEKYAQIRRINLDGSGDGDRRARRAQHGRLRLPPEDEASSGSPTTSATGCPRTCPRTS